MPRWRLSRARWLEPVHGYDQAQREAKQTQSDSQREGGASGIRDGVAVEESDCGDWIAVLLGEQHGSLGGPAAGQGGQATDALSVGAVDDGASDRDRGVCRTSHAAEFFNAISRMRYFFVWFGLCVWFGRVSLVAPLVVERTSCRWDGRVMGGYLVHKSPLVEPHDLDRLASFDRSVVQGDGVDAAERRDRPEPEVRVGRERPLEVAAQSWHAAQDAPRSARARRERRGEPHVVPVVSQDPVQIVSIPRIDPIATKVIRCGAGEE